MQEHKYLSILIYGRIASSNIDLFYIIPEKGKGNPCFPHTSAIVKILYISGRITGATRGICVSVTSRVNSRKQQWSQ